MAGEGGDKLTDKNLISLIEEELEDYAEIKIDMTAHKEILTSFREESIGIATNIFSVLLDYDDDLDQDLDEIGIDISGTDICIFAHNNL